MLSAAFGVKTTTVLMEMWSPRPDTQTGACHSMMNPENIMEIRSQQVPQHRWHVSRSQKHKACRIPSQEVPGAVGFTETECRGQEPGAGEGRGHSVFNGGQSFRVGR